MVVMYHNCMGAAWALFKTYSVLHRGKK